MCETNEIVTTSAITIPVREAVGTALAHDITEIRKGEFKGRAFKKGHVVTESDVEHLERLGKENLYVLRIAPDDVHEDEAAIALASALMGDGVKAGDEPKEGKVNILASRPGLLRVNREALRDFNMVAEVMCATMHTYTVVRENQMVAGTRAIPLVLKRAILEAAVKIASSVKKTGKPGTNQGVCGDAYSGVIEVREMFRPKAGIVITGNEVYHGKVKDSFAPVLREKIAQFDGEITGISYAPDDAAFIERKLMEHLSSGANVLITTGGMSVDPDDVTRFAIRNLGVRESHYGSPVLPGAMFMVAYLSGDAGTVPILGIPACGMYKKTTVFDLVLPAILAGLHVGREELAELGHGGLCLECPTCSYPVCPFGKY